MWSSRNNGVLFSDKIITSCVKRKGNAPEINALPVNIALLKLTERLLCCRRGHADMEILFGDFDISESEIPSAEYVCVLPEKDKLRVFHA